MAYRPMALSGYERVKRCRQRRSAIKGRLYLLKAWAALGSDVRTWTARHCASRKRWLIYYARRKQEEMQGFKLEPRKPSHWVGPIERAKKQAKASKHSVNLGLVRHLLS